MSGDVSVTVIGNLSVDRIDYAGAAGGGNGGAPACEGVARAAAADAERPPSPGGAAAFVAPALRGLGDTARIVTALAPADLALFTPALRGVGVPCEIRKAAATASFGLRYLTPADRELTVAAIGKRWNPDDVGGITGWVDVSSLLRSDFPAETLATLARGGATIAFDGQGLVRVPELGPLRLDADYDPAVLGHVTVLKLSDDEATIVAGRPFDADAAAALAVPEVIVTLGPGGCDLYVGGSVRHVPPAEVVDGVHATGAGDMFLAAYVVARSQDQPPLAAARRAGAIVAEQLTARRDG